MHCIAGFEPGGGNGRCVNRQSFSRASFYVGSASKLEEDSGFALSFPTAFERALTKVAGIAVQVTSLRPIGDAYTPTGRTLVSVVASSVGHLDGADNEARASFFARAQNQLHVFDKGRLADTLAEELGERLHDVWVETHEKVDHFCPNLRRWRGSEMGCEEDPSLAEAVAPAVPPSPANTPAPTDVQEADLLPHDQASDATVSPEDAWEGSDGPVDNEPADTGTNQWMTQASLVTGASLGTAAAVTLVAAVWRWRRGGATKPAEMTQSFRGLAGSTIW